LTARVSDGTVGHALRVLDTQQRQIGDPERWSCGVAAQYSGIMRSTEGAILLFQHSPSGVSSLAALPVLSPSIRHTPCFDVLRGHAHGELTHRMTSPHPSLAIASGRSGRAGP
jgi:hypothetical protein